MYIVYNASRKKEDEEIFISCAPNAEKIYKKNCLFAIQGPDSINVLKNIIDIPNNMNFFDILICKYNNNEIIVSRSGYTGEDGFELSIPNESAEYLITHLLKNKNTMLCGLGSRDSLGVEAPEVSLGLVKFPAKAFYLLSAIGVCKSSSEARRQIQGGGVRLDGQKITDPNLEFIDNKKLVGKVLQLGKKTFRRITT